jgi:hypothetical protein
VSKNKTPLETSCRSVGSLLDIAVPVRGEVTADNAEYHREISDPTLVFNSLPHTHPAQLNNTVSTLKAKFMAPMDWGHTPTYEEMSDRASPWYRPPHARPRKPTQSLGTEAESMVKGTPMERSLCHADKSDRITTNQIEPFIQSQKLVVSGSVSTPNPNMQDHYQAHQRHHDLTYNLKDKINSIAQSHASNTSSSNVSSDSGIIVITVQPEFRAEQYNNNLTAPHAANGTGCLTQEEVLTTHSEANVKDELISPSSAEARIPPHMRRPAKTGSNSDAPLALTLHSTTDGHMHNKMTNDMSVSANMAAANSQRNDQAHYVLPHMKGIEHRTCQKDPTLTSAAECTSSSRSLSTSSGGAPVQTTPPKIQQPITKQCVVVPSLPTIATRKPDNFDSVHLSMFTTGKNASELPKSYLATENEFLKAAAARPKPSTIRYKSGPSKPFRDPGISATFKNASTNPRWTTTTDTDSFLAAVKSKEDSQPITAKHYYRQHEEENKVVPTDTCGIMEISDRGPLQERSVHTSIFKPVVSSVVREATRDKKVSQRTKLPHIQDSNLVTTTTKVRCGASSSDTSKPQTTQLAQHSSTHTNTIPQAKHVKRLILEQNGPDGEIPSHASLCFEQQVLLEIKAQEQLRLTANGQPLTKNTLEIVTGFAPRSFVSSLDAFEGNFSDFSDDNEQPKEGVRARQGIPAQDELCDWDYNVMPPPCDWENDRPKFDSSSYLNAYIMEWSTQPSNDRVDVTSKLFASEITSNGVTVAIAHPIAFFKFTPPPEAPKTILGKSICRTYLSDNCYAN